MRSPITGFTKNLLFTDRGTTWAVWQLKALPYGYRPAHEKRGVRGVHTALFRALPGESLLLGLCATTDPASVVEAMITGVDLEARPDWALEAEATLDQLEQIELGQRTFWLAVPLANEGTSGLTEIFTSAWAGTKNMLGLPRSGPSQTRIHARLEQAEKIRRALPSALQPRPAVAAELLWLQLHAMRRGLDERTIPTTAAGEIEPEHFSAAALPTPLLDEGGQSDLSHRRAFNPFKRRFLKVTDLDTDESSYQVQMTVADTPAGGLTFPGGEWLGTIDDCGVPIDWALRLTILSRSEVTLRNTKALRQLNDQVEQRAGGAVMDATLGGLAPAARDLGEYTELMAQDELEVEVQATTILTVAAPTAEEAMEMAGDVKKHLGPGGWEFKISTEVGAQEELWWASLPGTPTTQTVRQLAQITTAKAFASAVPIVTTQIGDGQGVMWGVEISGGRPLPVLLDVVSAATKLDTALAIGVVGELGAGKSVALKTLALALIARGAQGIFIDRTDTGEWAHAFEDVSGTRVVEISENAQVSLDPLRVFDPPTAGEVAQAFFTALLHIPATSERGVLLGEILEPGYRADHGLSTSSRVLEHLATDCELPGAVELARTIRVFARKSFARAVFDDSLPALSLQDAALVFRTHRLSLPSPDELNIHHRFEEMAVEKIFGRAVYALVVAIARRICFASGEQLGFLGLDEASSLMLSPESERDVELWLRDGRKHLAGLLLGSHDPEKDFGNEVLRNLIPVRLLMRHRSEELARRGLKWLGLDPEDPELLDLVTQGLSPMPEDGSQPDPARRGEGLMRDFRNRYGMVKILPPARPDRADHVFTTPPGEKAKAH